MTGQGDIGSDVGGDVHDGREVDVGLEVGVALVNRLVVEEGPATFDAIVAVLSADRASVEAATPADTGSFEALAQRLHGVVLALSEGDIDSAAGLVNALLTEHSAHPHLAYEQGRWRLHHHPADAAVVPMWTAITADAFARLIGAARHDRVRRCSALDCRRFFVDETKNASKRFCATRCQNRVKAATFRARRRTGGTDD